jgi:hypothetical protein
VTEKSFWNKTEVRYMFRSTSVQLRRNSTPLVGDQHEMVRLKWLVFRLQGQLINCPVQFITRAEIGFTPSMRKKQPGGTRVQT